MLQPAIFNYMWVSICFVWIPSIETTSGPTSLTITPLEPIVGSSVYLTCNYSGTNTLGSSRWYKNNMLLGKLIYIDRGCYQGILSELDNYTTLCTSKESFTVILMSVTVDLHHTQWNCIQAATSSNSVVLTMQVPVNNISFDTPDSSILTLREHMSIRISCSTSFSRPRANITWYITESMELSKVSLQETNSSHVTNNGLLSTRSTLHINLNRSYNQWVLVCKAENIQGYKAVSENISLIITYPTNKPNILCSNNGIYKVIQNTKGRLTCSVDGGNPAGTLHWNCTGDTTETQGSHNNITQIFMWNATQSQYCVCSSTNTAGTNSTSVKIETLYPPVIKEIQNQTVFKGDSVTLQCDVSQANPPVNTIEWTSSKHNVSDATLTIRNISHVDDMVYTCAAHNIMDPSCQDVVNGTTSKSLHVEVLFPPDINITQGQTFTVKEGDRFSYTCPVVPGNPSITNTTWRRSNHTNPWSSSELLIPNVTRYDDSVYICYASNLMVNSHGETKIGNVSAAIHLIVQFQTNVTEFYIQPYRHNTSVVVTENANLTFECRLQSNPTADVRIYKMEDLVNSSKANKVLYFTTASCSGGPVSFSCHGNNSLSNNSSTRLIHLFVKCILRQDMNEDVQFNVTSAINQTVTLSYTALAYPYPRFVWYNNGSSINTEDTRFNIYSLELQTNLTILNVEERDFVEYTLTVSNGVGSINESFHLKPDGVPEVPTHLMQDEDSTTTTSIAINWRSGFKNGSEQYFTLMYNKQTENDWGNVTAQDTGPTGTTIHYNITGLSSGTIYDIVLFAVNDKGRSNYNATLSCRTKPIKLTVNDNDPSAIIGAAGGSAAGLLLIGVVIAGVVIFRRRLKNKPPVEQQASASLYENVRKDKSVLKHDINPLVVPTDRGIYENAELGKRKNQSYKPNGENSQSGEYVNFSNKKPAVKRMTKQEELSMRTMSPNIKATTQILTASDAPLPIPSKTEFAGLLCKVDDDECNNAHTNDENIYSNSSEKIERIENVFVHELFAFVAGKSVESFATEFHILPKGLTMPCSVAVKPENIKLNRYNGIFPYDHSRVTIHDDPDFFINACYMDGYKREKCYIASLGPTADTSSGFKTFWKMVWHEQSDIIIMVTNLREITGMKCEQYWPNIGSSKVFGEVTVTSRNVEEYAEYTVRTFNVSQATHNRTVTQLHFTAWPDKGVPDDLTSLLEFLQRMRSTPSPEPGPVIVHCSAGIGRTGTLIALDRLIAEGKATNSINVSTCVSSMRQQRVSMVQTQEQYVYIYKACVYALAYECECISAESFHDMFYATTDAQFGELLKKLKATVDNESDNEKKAIEKNKQDTTNRPSADIAGDRYRVRLYVDKESNNSDYTNAVYVNSFKTKNKFIAAQTPLKNFVQDFICTIFQEQCVCVLDMDGNTPSKLDVGVYIPPVNQSFTFGNFTISCEKLDSNPKYTVIKLKIENKGKYFNGEWTSYHFKYHDWKHGKDTPTDSSNFIEFVKEVDEYATQFGEKGSHILVHCLDASTRSGLFCFVACLLEKIQCERQVNIGNTLRQVRTRRKTTIKNAKQLKFCYEAVDAFVEMTKAQ